MDFKPTEAELAEFYKTQQKQNEQKEVTAFTQNETIAGVNDMNQQQAVVENVQPLPVIKNQPKPKGAISASEMIKIDYPVLDLGPYRKYFGAVPHNFDIVLHGQPGAGKTYFLLQFINWLANNVGNSLYVSTEEYGTKSLKDKINETIPSTSPNLYFDNKLDVEQLNYYKAVVLDSVNHAGLDISDYKKLREKHPNQIFILILQKTKGGDYKGGKDWEHEVDIFGEMQLDTETGQRFLDIPTKNRYGNLGRYNITK